MNELGPYGRELQRLTNNIAVVQAKRLEAMNRPREFYWLNILDPTTNVWELLDTEEVFMLAKYDSIKGESIAFHASMEYMKLSGWSLDKVLRLSGDAYTGGSFTKEIRITGFHPDDERINLIRANPRYVMKVIGSRRRLECNGIPGYALHFPELFYAYETMTKP